MAIKSAIFEKYYEMHNIHGVPEKNAQSSTHDKFGTVCRKMWLTVVKLRCIKLYAVFLLKHPVGIVCGFNKNLQKMRIKYLTFWPADGKISPKSAETSTVKKVWLLTELQRTSAGQNRRSWVMVWRCGGDDETWSCVMLHDVMIAVTLLRFFSRRRVGDANVTDKTAHSRRRT